MKMSVRNISFMQAAYMLCADGDAIGARLFRRSGIDIPEAYYLPPPHQIIFRTRHGNPARGIAQALSPAREMMPVRLLPERGVHAKAAQTSSRKRKPMTAQTLIRRGIPTIAYRH